MCGIIVITVSILKLLMVNTVNLIVKWYKNKYLSLKLNCKVREVEVKEPQESKVLI